MKNNIFTFYCKESKQNICKYIYSYHEFKFKVSRISVFENLLSSNYFPLMMSLHPILTIFTTMFLKPIILDSFIPYLVTVSLFIKCVTSREVLLWISLDKLNHSENLLAIFLKIIL